MIKFLGKNPHKKYVRQFPSSVVKHIIHKKSDEADTVTENKGLKTEKEMADERIEKIESIMGTKAPKRKVKVEKKDKGLIERTENSTILLTEDNKMVLND